MLWCRRTPWGIGREVEDWEVEDWEDVRWEIDAYVIADERLIRIYVSYMLVTNVESYIKQPELETLLQH
jgi:hypothetical protein